ncbi:MAG: DNA polymerase III subunit alpha [Flavobacteriales bacterium]|nr:DNA polymerase III subunit alpha [Flavobacteriales bacterium]
MFLNAHSWFSFKYGLLKPEALLEEAAKAGVRSFALTDIHSTAGIPDFVRLAPEHGIRPVAGIEFRQGSQVLYIGLARNNDGFRQLNQLLSPHLLDGHLLSPSAPQSPCALRSTASLMLGMTAGEAFFILPLATPPRELHANEFIGVRPAELTRLPFSPWMKQPAKLVAWLPVTFPQATRPVPFNTHRLLRTMAHNTLLSQVPSEELAAPDEHFRTPGEVRHLYRDFPQLLRNAERLLEQCSIAFDGSDKTPKVFGSSAAADREQLHLLAREGLHRRYVRLAPTALARLQHELEVIERMGFISYFLINHDIVRYAQSRGFFHVGRGSGANSLVAYCLGITDVDPIELNLYFERFISTARKKPPDFDIDFSWKDRDEVFRYIFDKYNGPFGSAQGAGTSGIHAAQVATYTTFQWRGAVRELGKALGLPPAEIDALSEGRSYYGGGRPSELVRSGHADRVATAVVRYAQRIIGMPHQFGIHVGGILVSEEPITSYSALHRPPKGFPVVQFSLLEAEDLGLHKFDILSQRGLGHIRDAVELVGGMARPEGDQGACTVDPMGRPNRRPVASGEAAIDIHAIPRFKQDPAIKQLLRTGDTVGCFYVESPAMRMLLKKLRVEDYLTLVAASSIIRPGVAESGMMREYILRHNDPERVRRAPKELLEIMPDTYGVMVYQEDVLKVAHHYAGLSLEEADILRRGMTARFRERPEFKAVEEKFFSNCKAMGRPDEQAREVWRQIESFASFSFAKGHSASYAVESYQSLWLKAHYPLEFLVAVANNFGGFYSTEFYLHEAKRHGAVIEAPCVNVSGELCVLRRSKDQKIRRSDNQKIRRSDDRKMEMTGGAEMDRSTCTVDPLGRRDRCDHAPPAIPAKPRIFLGLANIKSLNDETVRLILRERERHGPFTGLEDLLHRVPLPLEQARILIRAGALRFTGRSKPELLWDLTLLHTGKEAAAAGRCQGDFFITKVEEPVLPELHHYPLADAYDELELLGFPLCDPFSLVEGGSDDQTIRRSENGRNAILQREMHQYIGKRVTMLGYMVHVKSTTTTHGQRMTFGSFIDTAGDLWDSTQFPAVAARHPFRGRGVYRLTGVVEEEFGHCALRTQSVEKLPWKPDPRYGER